MSIPATPSNVAHLLRRAAFGGTPDEIAAASARGIEATVNHLLDFHASPPDHQPHGLPAIAKQMDGKADSKIEVLQRWWLDRMVTSPCPAQEKLTLYWHGHFATSVEKVDSDVLMWRQNALLRRLGMESFGTIVRALSHDPALLIFLDAPDNAADAPNENFARELMELFTLGRNRGYTQADVRAAARGFTGWTVDDHEDGHGTYAFRFDRAAHDGDLKSFLGQTGRWTGDDIVQIILQRRECAEFVAGRIWQRFAGTPAAPELLADLLPDGSWATLPVRDLLQRIFTHPAFYERIAIQTMVSSPLEFLGRAMRAFSLTTRDLPDAVDLLQAMGQEPFAPPNVGGWGMGRYWTSTAASAARVNAAYAVGQAVAERAGRGRLQANRALLALVDADELLIPALFGRVGVVDVSPATMAAVLQYHSTDEDAPGKLAGAIALVLLAPEAQLQ